MMQAAFLVVVALFLVLLPWIQVLDVGMTSEVTVDGITTSAIIVMAITLVFSLITWGLLSWAAKNILFSGVTLGIISGASTVVPFLQVLGPVSGMLVGIAAGFAAFMLQKKMTSPAKNRPVVIAAATLAAAYLALLATVLAFQGSYVWDTGSGIGAWTGTPDGIGESGFDGTSGNSIGFAYFLPAISSLIATGLIIRGKKASEN